MSTFIYIIAGIFFGALSSFVAITAGFNIGDTMYWVIGLPIILSGVTLVRWLDKN